VGEERVEDRGLMCLAIPGRVVEIVDEQARLAKVDVSGVVRNVNVGLLDDVGPDDWVLIHVGFALSKVDEEEARATLALLVQMGEAYEQELRELSASVIE
jgi:hydrogenase expression/formation protein HypC